MAIQVISTRDISRPGNDVYIYEGVSLVEQFGVYAVIVVRKITGWTNSQSVFTLFSGYNYEEACEKFNKYNGEF